MSKKVAPPAAAQKFFFIQFTSWLCRLPSFLCYIQWRKKFRLWLYFNSAFVRPLKSDSLRELIFVDDYNFFFISLCFHIIHFQLYAAVTGGLVHWRAIIEFPHENIFHIFISHFSLARRFYIFCALLQFTLWGFFFLLRFIHFFFRLAGWCVRMETYCRRARTQLIYWLFITWFISHIHKLLIKYTHWIKE